MAQMLVHAVCITLPHTPGEILHPRPVVCSARKLRPGRVSAVTSTNQQDHQHSAVVRGRGSNFFTAVAHATKMAYRLTKAIQEEEEEEEVTA